MHLYTTIFCMHFTSTRRIKTSNSKYKLNAIESRKYNSSPGVEQKTGTRQKEAKGTFVDFDFEWLLIVFFASTVQFVS